MTEVQIMRIDLVHENELKEFVSWLSQDKLSKIRQYKNIDDFNRSLIAEGLVRKRIGDMTAQHPQEISIVEDENGKPFLKDIPGLYFNVSHSEQYVACVISDRPCGIDVEKITEFDSDVVKRFFTKDENALIECVDSKSRKELFFDLWTIKESYIKYKGLGLRMPLNSFSVRNGTTGYCIDYPEERESYIYVPDIIPDYKLAICCMDFNLHYCCNRQIIMRSDIKSPQPFASWSNSL